LERRKQKERIIKRSFVIVLLVFILLCISAVEEEYTADYWIQKGDEFFNKGSYDIAIDCYNRAIELDPQYADAWSNHGYVLYDKFRRIRNLDKYDEALDLAIKINPIDDYFWREKSFILRSIGKYDEAIQALDKAIEINPQMGYYWVDKGRMLDEHLDRYDEAIQAFNKAIEINDAYSSIAWVGKGNALHRLCKYNEQFGKEGNSTLLNATPIEMCMYNAIQAYDKAIEINPVNEPAWYGKGNALFEMMQFPEAIQAYDKAIEISPVNEPAWYGKGNAFCMWGKEIMTLNTTLNTTPNEMRMILYNDAIQAYDKAIDIDPNNAKAWYSKAYALFNSYKENEAVQACDEAIRLDPNNAKAWFYKGFYVYWRGQAGDPAENCVEAIKPFNDKARSLLRMQRQAENSVEAIKPFNEAIRLDPNYAEAWFYKSVAISILGGHEQAIKCYEEAIRLNPNLARGGYIESMLNITSRCRPDSSGRIRHN
jgi:tetratricopeptide (TPR) repeat protein